MGQEHRSIWGRQAGGSRPGAEGVFSDMQAFAGEHPGRIKQDHGSISPGSNRFGTSRGDDQGRFISNGGELPLAV